YCQLTTESKAAYLTVATFIVKQSFSEAFTLCHETAKAARSPLNGGASYRAGLICQPVVFRSFPNNPS
ncbi:hypothetical protein, partial [Endozoicomonas sp. YOMI1]|uniref:hypothetical protein n=1 Tax=Endozoicomonas sp. YOMI1 TaxID=2828739 RepID=UPI002148C24F